MAKTFKLLIAINFGVIVYFMAVKSLIIWPLFIPLLLLVLLWYITSFVVTEKMIVKARGEEKFFFLRCQMIDEVKNELIYGALAITSNEIVFCRRKGASGGIEVFWSCFTGALEGYELRKVDDFHPGIMLNIKGETKPKRIVSKEISKKEKEFRAALGWPEEDESAPIV